MVMDRKKFEKIYYSLPSDRGKTVQWYLKNNEKFEYMI